jgi:hypothetical protein
MKSPWNKTRVGTSYFVCRAAAVTYYRRVAAADAAGHIADEKLKAGEIHLGYPPGCRPGDVVLIDGGLRYAILQD